MLGYSSLELETLDDADDFDESDLSSFCAWFLTNSSRFWGKPRLSSALGSSGIGRGTDDTTGCKKHCLMLQSTYLYQQKYGHQTYGYEKKFNGLLTDNDC